MVDTFRIETIVGWFVFVYQLHVVAEIDAIYLSLYFISDQLRVGFSNSSSNSDSAGRGVFRLGRVLAGSAGNEGINRVVEA
jgi:hypothetical protein